MTGTSSCQELGARSKQVKIAGEDFVIMAPHWTTADEVVRLYFAILGDPDHIFAEITRLADGGIEDDARIMRHLVFDSIQNQKAAPADVARFLELMTDRTAEFFLSGPFTSEDIMGLVREAGDLVPFEAKQRSTSELVGSYLASFANSTTAHAPTLPTDADGDPPTSSG